MEEGAEGGEARQTGPAARVADEDDGLRGDIVDASPRSHRFLPPTVVVLTSLWLTRSFWLPGGYVVGFDTYGYSGPNVEVTLAAVRDWRLPLVNELIFAGVPHLGNPQAGVLYPAHLIGLLLDTNRAMGVVVTLHVVLLGIGMLVLGRRLGFGQVGATASAVVAVAAGATLTKSVQYEQIQVLAWAPLLLAAIHATLTSSRTLASSAALAGTTAAVLLAGHPQLVYETVVLAAAATVGFAIGDSRWRRLGWTALGAGLGVLIALPQLVAALQATADSAVTGGRTLAELEAAGLSMQPEHVVRAVLGTVQDRDPAAFAGGFESIGFVGVIACLLAVVGVVRTISDRATRPWAISLSVTAVVCLAWTTGPGNVVFRAAYEVLPGFDLARASARWMVVVVLIAALFAGAGVGALRRGVTRTQLLALGVATTVTFVAVAVGPLTTADRRSASIWIVTAVAALALIAAPALAAEIRGRGWSRPRVIGVTTVGLLLLGAVELLLMSLPSMPQRLRDDVAFTDHATPTSEWLAAQERGSTIALTDDGVPAAYQVPGMRPNTNALSGVPSPDGYDGGVQITERWAEMLRRFTPTPPIELPLRNSLQLPVDPEPLGRLGVRFVIIDLDRPAATFIPDWDGPVAVDEEFAVYENPFWIGDAVAWSATAPVQGSAADMLRATPEVAVNTALIDDPEGALTCLQGCAPVGLDAEFRTPEHIVVETDLGRPALVSVTRQALPGWSVTVDGESADEVVVDGFLLGVEVPAGAHTVEWRYASPWLGWTLLVALVAVTAAISMVVVGTVVGRADSSSRRDDRSIVTDET